MTLDRTGIAAALASHGALVRVVVAEARGSVPRGRGTAMLVWESGFSGTIGGGALEWQALAAAREVLASGAVRVLRLPLGPALGQCCGGSVTLVLERLTEVPPSPWLRRVEGAAAEPETARPGLSNGWMREEDGPAARPIWIWGAGHVGRALCQVLAPLPDMAITLVDDDAARLPDVPDGVSPLVAADMPRAMAHAPAGAEHLIVTYSHEIDLGLCHAALRRGFAFCGLIGSTTKWARFRSRLGDLGHGPDEIARITCPIGDPSLGKHPQAIAVGVAAGLLSARMPMLAAEGNDI